MIEKAVSDEAEEERAVGIQPFAARPAVTVTFSDACTCLHNHGVSRWSVKTETDQPPTTIAQDHQLTPSAIAAWAGPGGTFNMQTPRTGKENEWFVLEGKVTEVHAEADGDLHIQLQDKTGNGREVVVEVPLGSTWCDMRLTVFSWTNTNFPFTTQSGKILALVSHPVIRVTGRAFYDFEHGHGNTALNARPNPNVTIWEIHPVMKLEILNGGQ